MKRPAFQFYPGDWMRSTDLRSCSIGARGLWIDMICLMHEGNPYGFLRVGDKDILPDTLARIVGGVHTQIEEWLIELEQAGVLSRDQGGTIYSRRMVRDEDVRVRRSAGGEKSLLHPNVQQRKGNPIRVSSRPSLGGSPATASASALQDTSPPAPLRVSSSNAVLQNPSPLTNTNTSPPKVNGNHYRKDAESLIEFLNLKTGKAFRPVEANLKFIEARLQSGATVPQCRALIIRKQREWKDKPDMQQYLRPETLFNATKFESYLGECVLPKEESHGDQT